MRLPFDLADLVDGVAERHAGREVERDRHRRLLALMVDHQRPHRRHHLRHRIERNGAALRGLHIELREIGGIDAEFRLRLHDDLIVVGRHVDGADLPRAIGIEQLVTHLIYGDAEHRGLLAVDLDGQLRILYVEIVGDVEQPRHLRYLLAHLRR